VTGQFEGLPRSTVEVGGRRYVAVELAPSEHAPVAPTAGPPPLLAWAILCSSGVIFSLAAVAALLLVGFDSPAVPALAVAVIVGGLATVALSAGAAMRLQDARASQHLLADAVRRGQR
jgi:hypothetical protein